MMRESRQPTLLLLLAAFVATTPWMLGDFWLFVEIEVLVFALYAVSFNLLFGFGGMLPFGHAALYGLGAYVIAILMKKAAWGWVVSLAAAPVVCALASVFVAFFCVRLSGIYLGMLSFAFQMLLYTVVLKWSDLTGGDDGLSGVTTSALRANPAALFYLALVLVSASLVFLWFLVRSPFGTGLRAIRNNAVKSQAIGINTALHRGVAFVIAGAFAGLAGALSALANQSVYPGWLNWNASAVPIVIAVLGGMRSFLGPVVGAVVYVLLQTFLTGYTEYWSLLLGILIIAIVMLMPNGIMGWWDKPRDV
jgi:branched-chain amino acid transport system permease protein